MTRAVDGVSFDLFPGETLGIVGESGCGKSVTALSIMRLLPPRLARTVGGSVTFENRDLVALDESEMRKLRGNRLAMIFQEPMTSLNPVLTVGHQIAESVRIHTGAGASAARARAVEMLRLVKIPDAERRLNDYPHQFSGGMRQRVMIATALACNPTLADRRRADHRARRDDPGADPRADAGAEGAHRRRGHPHHAQSRHRGRDLPPRDGDVCGAQDRGSRPPPNCSTGRRIPTRAA